MAEAKEDQERGDEERRTDPAAEPRSPGDQQAESPTGSDLARPDESEDAESIPEELLEIVQELSEDDPEKAKSVLRFAMEATAWSGPIPPPATLAAYNSAYEGCARDLMEMAQKQVDHRIDIERTVIGADIALRAHGQIYGFVVVMATIVGGVVLVGMGRSIYGFGTLLAGLVSLAGLFVYRRQQQSEELVEKREALSQSIARARAEASEERVGTPDDGENE